MIDSKSFVLGKNFMMCGKFPSFLFYLDVQYRCCMAVVSSCSSALGSFLSTDAILVFSVGPLLFESKKMFDFVKSKEVEDHVKSL